MTDQQVRPKEDEEHAERVARPPLLPPAAYAPPMAAGVASPTTAMYGRGLPPLNPVSGLAIGGFIVGLLGIPFFMVPLPGLVPLIALILSAFGLREVNQKPLRGRGLAIAGLVLGLVGVILTVFAYVLIAQVQGANMPATSTLYHST